MAGLAGVLAAMAACGAPSVASATTGLTPEESTGPFPADGSQRINILTESGIVRSDITTSFGASTTRAAGVPLTIELTVLGGASGTAPMKGAAVYVWHCDGNGDYSLYATGVEQENYLRGVQVAGADGSVRFSSIYPAAYPGRWPHIHFEVYPDLSSATSASAVLRTSELALPEDSCAVVYATAGYEQSVSNLARESLRSDSAFGDGYDLQLATMSGDVRRGYTAALDVRV